MSVIPLSFKADPAAMRAAVNENTILMVGSAISYAHGVVDPIRELGQIALEKDVLLHVDGCMGGFLLPYFRRLGAPVPDFELHVPGVTSISMNFHKYAFAAKGASVILYKSADLRKYQLYACSNWTGYTVINTTLQSTKSVGPLAAAWAVLNHFGDAGYLALAKQVLDCTQRIADEVERIPGHELLGKPEMNLLAFTSDGPSVFHEKTYNVYMVSRFVSMNSDYLPVANELQQYWGQVGPRESYLFFSQSLPKKKQFNKYIKSSTEHEEYEEWLLELIAKHYAVSLSEAEDYLKIYYSSSKNRSELKELVAGYGIDEKIMKKARLG